MNSNNQSGSGFTLATHQTAAEKKAYLFAKQNHGDQMYGAVPYMFHLAMVRGALLEFDPENVLKLGCAAWLHDVVEDTPVTLDELTMLFDDHTVNSVMAVTGRGKNRKERNECMYQACAVYPQAIPLKLADRIANTRVSMSGRDPADASMFAKYRAEYPTFIQRLSHSVIQHQASLSPEYHKIFAEMWNVLTDLYR